MKKLLLFISIIFIFQSNFVIAQFGDTLANVTISNIQKTKTSNIKFDLYLQNISNKWNYYANSTFHIKFPDETAINYVDCSIKLETSQLPIVPETGLDYPTSGYYVQSQVLNNFFSISILGSKEYQTSLFVPKDSSILLGTFSIENTKGEYLPDSLFWLQPTSYFQAMAYKIDHDSLVKNNIIWYFTHDNIEMNDGTSNLVNFITPSRPNYKTELIDFIVKYDRVKKLYYEWIMRTEYDVYGYTITRAIRPAVSIDPQNLDYDTIGSCLPGSAYFRPEFIANGNSFTERTYGKFDDSVDYRSVQYCYNLYAHFINETGITTGKLLATRCPYIPNAVIVEAEIVDPKDYPGAKESPTVRFKIDDDCYVTGTIIDAIGRTVETLTLSQTDEIIDNLRLYKGEYISSYTPPPWVANGYYQFIITAYPIEDKSVEISQTIVPFFLMRSD